MLRCVLYPGAQPRAHLLRVATRTRKDSGLQRAELDTAGESGGVRSTSSSQGMPTQSSARLCDPGMPRPAGQRRESSSHLATDPPGLTDASACPARGRKRGSKGAVTVDGGKHISVDEGCLRQPLSREGEPSLGLQKNYRRENNFEEEEQIFRTCTTCSQDSLQSRKQKQHAKDRHIDQGH